MKSLKISLLSFLLHHANRLGKDAAFYMIKNKILAQYGTHLCYDVQFIEGKKCFTCDGTGTYWDYCYQDEEDKEESCWRCDDGWFKSPTWNILAKIQFGKYTFHQPYKRVYSKPDITIPLIEGYISHTPAKFAPLAKFILFAIYKPKYCFIKYVFNPYDLEYRWYKFLKRFKKKNADDYLPF